MNRSVHTLLVPFDLHRETAETEENFISAFLLSMEPQEDQDLQHHVRLLDEVGGGTHFNLDEISNITPGSIEFGVLEADSSLEQSLEQRRAAMMETQSFSSLDGSTVFQEEKEKYESEGIIQV